MGLNYEVIVQLNLTLFLVQNKEIIFNMNTESINNKTNNDDIPKEKKDLNIMDVKQEN